MKVSDEFEWFDFQETISRKAFDQVEKVVHMLGIDRVTKREAQLMLSTLYDATSGVARKDTSDLIYEVIKQIRKEMDGYDPL
jgi:hypothetical protein